jgi:hypothetical protein
MVRGRLGIILAFALAVTGATAIMVSPITSKSTPVNIIGGLLVAGGVTALTMKMMRQ